MTLAQCLEEIKNIYLDGNVEAVTNLGIGLIHELREKFYPECNYPQNGWLLYCMENAPCLCHKKLKIIVRISFEKEKIVTPNKNLTFEEGKSNVLHLNPS